MPPATQEKTYGKKSSDENPKYKQLLRETEKIVSAQLKKRDVLLGDEYIEEEALDLLEHLGMVEEHEVGYSLTEKGERLMESGKEKVIIENTYSKALAKKYEEYARAQ